MVSHVNRALEQGAGSQALLDTYLAQTFSARTLCDVAERLWHENKLSRLQANRYEERILAYIGKDGRWLYSRYVPQDGSKPCGVVFQNSDYMSSQQEK